MKKILFSLFGIAIAIASMAKDNIKFANTIEVLPSDTKETIIAKAAHVVPTANQYEALKN